MVVRRGRNNRTMMKFIEREIFNDDESLDPNKKVLKKRSRPTKLDALSYLEEEFPGVIQL